MKKLLVAWLAFCAFVSWGDVYSDAVCWFRGVAKDGHGGAGAGDGYYSNNDQYDVCGRNFNGNSSYNATNIAYCVETGIQPSRYVTRTMNTVYFPQHVYVTDAATGAGFGRPALIQIALPELYSTYSVCCRFRPDEHMPLVGQMSVLLSLGYAYQNGGLLVAVYETGPNSFNLVVYQHNRMTTLTQIRADWTDLALSVDSTKISWKACQSSTGDYVAATKQGTVNLVAGSDPTLNAKRLRIGGDTQCWEDKNYTPTTQSENWRCFRGSVQHVALWNRVLTDAEKFEAMAWPRTDLMKVGIDNDSTDDYSGTVKIGGIDADDDIWNLPKTIASGESVTIRFPLMDKWEIQSKQTLKVKLTSDSGAGLFAAQLNGSDLGEPELHGASLYWFVPADLLVLGTNDLLLTRADAGMDALKVDSISLGGSVQLGLQNNSETEFIHESVGLKDYYLTDGNFKDICKGLSPSAGTPFTYNIHIEEQDDFRRQNCRHLLEYRFGGGGTKTGRPDVTLTLNGKVLKTFSTASWVSGAIKLAPGVLQTGDNVLQLKAAANGEGSQWALMDYLRLSVFEPSNGMMLIVR